MSGPQHIWCYRRAHGFTYGQFLANFALNLSSLAMSQARRRAFYYRRAHRFGC